jgi:hypothetical protein
MRTEDILALLADGEGGGGARANLNEGSHALKESFTVIKWEIWTVDILALLADGEEGETISTKGP